MSSIEDGKRANKGAAARVLGMPKKFAKLLEAIPLGTQKGGLPPELVRYLLKGVAKARLTAEDADALPTFSFFKEKVSRAHSMADYMRQVLNLERKIRRDNPTFSATLPLFLPNQRTLKPEPVGSGVALRIAGHTFILTAAHVTDLESEGSRLMAPGRDCLISLNGYFSKMRLPPSGLRDDDKLDVAYFCLDEDCSNNLHPSVRKLDRHEVILEKDPVHRLEYSFAGYPWRKSVVRGKAIETPLSTFTGLEADKHDYESLGLRRGEHIVMRFNRKRVVHDRKRQQIVAPLPHGMSGGGVYAWTAAALKKSPVSLPLVGIVNRYIADRSLLIATRLHVYINCISHEYPGLFKRGDQSA